MACGPFVWNFKCIYKHLRKFRDVRKKITQAGIKLLNTMGNHTETKMKRAESIHDNAHRTQHKSISECAELIYCIIFIICSNIQSTMRWRNAMHMLFCNNFHWRWSGNSLSKLNIFQTATFFCTSILTYSLCMCVPPLPIKLPIGYVRLFGSFGE